MRPRAFARCLYSFLRFYSVMQKRDYVTASSEDSVKKINWLCKHLVSEEQICTLQLCCPNVSLRSAVPKPFLPLDLIPEFLYYELVANRDPNVKHRSKVEFLVCLAISDSLTCAHDLGKKAIE